MTKQQLINRVLLIMNEAGMSDSQGAAIIGADSAQVDRYIESSYVDAWRRCVKVMPRVWFENKSFAEATLVPDLEKGTGHVVLPVDFYVLTRFKMQGWQKAVHEAALENERTSNIQSNDYTRGSSIRPVCTLSIKVDASGTKHILNYYSLKKGLTSHVVEEAIYVPVATPLTEIAMDDEVNLHDQVVEPLAYILASSVFTMFEKYDISKALEARAAEMFPGLQTVKMGTLTTKQ